MMSARATQSRKSTKLSTRTPTKSHSTHISSFSIIEISSGSEEECTHYNNKSSKRNQRIESPKKNLETNSASNNLIASSYSSDSVSDSEILQSKLTETKPTKFLVSPRKDKVRSVTADIENVTPPKQAKCDNTPEESPTKTFSPSSLFRELDLNSPPLNGVKPPKARQSVYQSARKAMYSNAPKTMPGRENELRELTEFITEHLEEATSGSLYVSGPPGTGKTATLNMILQRNDISKNLQTAYINCTGIKSPGAIYSKIVQELDIKSSGRSEKDYISAITKYLSKSYRPILLVLDEIDQLAQTTAHQRTLYTLFSLPSTEHSLILIGIANALDLTDRLLPRLQSRCSTDFKPKLLHFAPYSRAQIVTILTERLTDALGDDVEVFDKSALAMIAGKVAAMSGDVRKALDIGRRVVEIVEGQVDGKAVLKSIENDPTKTVNLHQVVNVLNTIYGTSNNLSNQQSDSTFPLQQKIIICSLLLHLKHGKSKDITVGKLHEIYNRICTKRNIVAVDQAEFYCLLGLVETRGIIRVSGKKDRRLHKVNLEWDEEEVELALRDKEMISCILQDDRCLNRIQIYSVRYWLRLNDVPQYSCVYEVAYLQRTLRLPDFYCNKNFNYGYYS